MILLEDSLENLIHCVESLINLLFLDGERGSESDNGIMSVSAENAIGDHGL